MRSRQFPGYEGHILITESPYSVPRVAELELPVSQKPILKDVRVEEYILVGGRVGE